MVQFEQKVHVSARVSTSVRLIVVPSTCTMRKLFYFLIVRIRFGTTFRSLLDSDPHGRFLVWIKHETECGSQTVLVTTSGQDPKRYCDNTTLRFCIIP